MPQPKPLEREALEAAIKELIIKSRYDKLVPLIADFVAERVLAELNDLSMAVVEPCEPDCGEVRHALHQGSWNAHLVIEKRIAELEGQANNADVEFEGGNRG